MKNKGEGAKAEGKVFRPWCHERRGERRKIEGWLPQPLPIEHPSSMGSSIAKLHEEESYVEQK